MYIPQASYTFRKEMNGISFNILAYVFVLIMPIGLFVETNPCIRSKTALVKIQLSQTHHPPTPQL